MDVATSLLVYRSCWPSPQQAALVLHRLGLRPPGARPKTLATVGAITGFTASWVGHLERRARAFAERTKPPRSLLEALHLLGAGTPRLVSDAALELFDAGLVHDIVHPGSVAAVASLFGVPVPFETVEGQGRTLVVPQSARPRVRAVEILMGQELRRSGFANLADLGGRTGLSVDALTVLVDRQRGLHRRDAVVWRAPDHPGYPLPRMLDRMLAVGSQGVQDLCDGLTVAWRYLPGADPPGDGLLRDYVASQERYHLEGDEVRLVDPSSARPTRVDAALLATYGLAGENEVTAERLRQELVAAGMGPPGAQSLLTTSPLLRRTRRGYYRLRQPLISATSGSPAAQQTGREPETGCKPKSRFVR